jgi:hypothetical protein
MPVETIGGDGHIITGSDIEKFQLLALKGALSLELKGMKRRGRSALSIVKERFGFKGSKQKVYDQFVAYLRAENILRG